MFPSTYQSYAINFPRYWIVRDEPAEKTYSSSSAKSPHESMLFHVSAGDYITTLATILRFFEESIKENKITPEMRALQAKSIKEVIGDLLYLNRDYTITPKVSMPKKENE